MKHVLFMVLFLGLYLGCDNSSFELRNTTYIGQFKSMEFVRSGNGGPTRVRVMTDKVVYVIPIWRDFQTVPTFIRIGDSVFVSDREEYKWITFREKQGNQ